MRVISIALKDLLITLKDKRALLLIILMPLVLIFVLGLALSSAFNSNPEIKKFQIALVNEDKGKYAEEFKNFLKADEIKKMMDVKEMDYDAAAKKVKKGDIAALILLPKDYSAAVNSGKNTKIQIYKDPGNALDANIVESIVKSYTGVASSVTGSAKAADTVFKNYKLDGNMVLPEVLKVINNNRETNFKEINLNGKKALSAMQYYSAAMLVMYILFVAMMGATSIIQEREENTLARMMGAAVSKTNIIAGKLLGLFVLGVLEVTVLIVFTKYAYHTEWGNSIPGIVLLSAAMIFAACGFAMFVATLFKTSKAVNSVSPAAIMVISFLGGSMYPLYGMSESLQKVAKITPNNWALRGYLSLMMNDGLSSIITPVLVLSAIGLVLMTAGISRLKLQ